MSREVRGWLTLILGIIIMAWGLWYIAKGAQ